ncbi:MAG: tetratricopeptide repeat protein [Pyrinomonadaceae bacterium]
MKTLIILILLAVFAISLSAQAKSPEEEAKQKAELAAKNKFIEEQNVAFIQGNKLFAEKAYNEAFKIYADIIKKYLGVIPDHPGLPSIVINASLAMRMSMTDTYNVAIKSGPAAEKDPAIAKARDETLESARAGFRRAAELANTAVKLAFDADISPKFANANTKAQYLSALLNRVEAVSVVAQYVEHAVSDETHQVFLQFLAVEKDAVNKQKAWLKLAKLYSDTGDLEKANAIYAMILKDSPDNIDALFHGGTCLMAMSDKPGMITAAGYLKRFLKLAPTNDPRRKDAQDQLDYLKIFEIN